MEALYAICVTARHINERLVFSDNLHCILLEPLHKLRLESAADTVPHSFPNAFGRCTAELFPYLAAEGNRMNSKRNPWFTTEVKSYLLKLVSNFRETASQQLLADENIANKSSHSEPVQRAAQASSRQTSGDILALSLALNSSPYYFPSFA